MPRPIHATISVSALQHNLDVVRRRLDDTAQTLSGTAPSIWAVIKSNAYGHGLDAALLGFSSAQGLAMLDLDEAVRCREGGWGGPILLLEGFFQPADLELVDRYHLTTTVHTVEQLEMLSHARLSRRVDIMLKFNSGMNRLGFSAEAYPQAYATALQLHERGVLGSIGKMMHFPCADGPQGVAGPLERFKAAIQGFEDGPISVCNSAATLRYPEISVTQGSEAHWVRPGICLYGASPFSDQRAEEFGLLPAMSLRSEIIGIQNVMPGDEIGYGATFRADKPMRIGVVACGYADGYPRHAGTGTPIIVGGVLTRLVGRVSMDMMMVDLTHIPMARVGTAVSLWGCDGLSVDDVAQAAGTIGYELLCALAPRVPVKRIP
jgi:alanine racemase